MLARFRLTLQKLLNRPPTTLSQGPSSLPIEIESTGSERSGPVGSEAAEGGRRQQLFCYPSLNPGARLKIRFIRWLIYIS